MANKPSYEELEQRVKELEKEAVKRKKAEEHLRESEKRYRDLYENAPNAYFSVSAEDGAILRCNTAALNLLGYDRDTLMRMKVFNLYADTHDGVSKAQNIFKRFKRGESIQDVELQMKHKDGNSIWINLSVEPVKDRYGNITESRSMVIDISERKRAQQALEEREHRYRLLFNSGTDAVFIHQPTPAGTPGKFIEVNDVACRMYGYTREELLNLTPIKLSPPDTVGDVKARVQKLSAHRNILFETVHVTKEGKKIPVEIHSQMFELDGQPTVISIVRDITRREHAETALRESEAQKRAILDASIDRIRYVDKDMRIIWINKTTAMPLGMSPEELVGEVCYKLLVGRDTPCEGCPTVRAQETGEIERAVMSQPKIKGVVGESYWDTYCVPLKNETGEIVSFIQIARNITDQKRAEEHIHTLTQQLMTAHEAERQMISRELHDRVGQDLSTLKIGCDTLFDNQPEVPPEIRQKVSELSKLLQRCIMAVRDLAYDLRPLSLDQLGLVQTIFQYCEALSEKTGLSVDFTSAGMDDLNLDFDTEINLYRLIQEGLINITKHADASHVTVRLVTSFPTIILRIEDDGKGFDVKDRLITAMNEKRMGLRSMEERVSLLGGKMKIESRPGKGTKILIEVPYRGKKSGSKKDHIDR